MPVANNDRIAGLTSASSRVRCAGTDQIRSPTMQTDVDLPQIQTVESSQSANFFRTLTADFEAQ